MRHQNFDANQVDLIRSRLICYKVKKRRTWYDVAGDMIESGIAGLVGNAEGEDAISEESVRRFAKGKQIPGFGRLEGITRFLIERSFLSDTEIEQQSLDLTDVQSLGGYQFPIDSRLDGADHLYAGLIGRWKFITPPITRGPNRRTEIELKLISRDSSSGPLIVVEEYLQINYSPDFSGLRGRVVKSRRSRGLFYPLSGGFFLLALKDELENSNRVYVSLKASGVEYHELYLVDNELSLPSSYIDSRINLHNPDNSYNVTMYVLLFNKIGELDD